MTENQSNPFVPPGSVSVAMCTFNGAAYLRAQLDSIASQTLQPCELIVCDDRSSDTTLDILQAFAQTSPFPVQIHVNPTRLGSTSNFEQAMRLCRGEFIALCDQDDLWLPEKLEELVALLTESPAVSGVFSDAELIDGNSNPLNRRLWQHLRFIGHTRKTFAFDPISVLLRHDVVTGATLLFRSNVLSLFDRIPPSWVHDGWLTWIIALHFTMRMTTSPLTRYRIHHAQQLGTGQQGVLNRVRTVRQKERERLRRVSGQFQDLFDYVRSLPNCDPSVARRIQEKSDFLRNRADLPANVLHRAVRVLANYTHYRKFARGIRSARKDLFLGQ